MTLDGHSTTLSDRELASIGDRTRPLREPYDFTQHGFSEKQVAVTLAREVMALRQLVRAFIAAAPASDLAPTATEYLGFNITPEQR